MTFLARVRTCLFAALALACCLARAQPRDGSHDFDFNLGTWHTSIQRTLDPFASAPRVVHIEGTVSVRPVWDGRAQLEEIEADGPLGHWQALTMFLYNPRSGQWTQAFVNSASGTLSSALVGSFADGKAELYQNDVVDGRSILVRGTWSEIKPTSHRYEESYSDDGGKTWRRAFDAQLTKVNGPVASPALPARADGHDFDFEVGVWKTHSRRLLHPLAGPREWVELDGVTRVSKVWNGRANLAEYKAQGADGAPLELLSLRLYDPRAKQWSLNFANPKAGAIGIANVGQFRNGRGDFYSYEEVEGRYVLIRFSIWPTGKDTARSEQAFSTDGGRTWEVNWINEYSRAADGM